MARRIHFIAGMIVALFAAPLLAVPLAPGGFANLTGTTAAARPELAGTVIADVTRPFSVDVGGGNFTTGSVRDFVVRETVSGTLDFYYSISNDVSSSGSVDFVTRTNFTGVSTDVDWRSDQGGTISPDQASRSAAGDSVLFDFFANNLLFPGQTSRDFFVKTNATVFNEQGSGALAITSQLGGGSFNFATFQPAVPEPGTGLALLGLACIAVRGRRRD